MSSPAPCFWNKVTEVLVNCSLNLLRNDLNKNILLCANGNGEDWCLLRTEQVFPWSLCVNQKSNGVNLSALSITLERRAARGVLQVPRLCSRSGTAVTQPVLALLLHKALVAPSEGSVSV